MAVPVKVVHWSSEQDADIDRMLENEPDIVLRSVSTLPALLPLLRDSDALILPSPRFSAQLALELVPKNAPSLRWIHLTSAGYDNVVSIGVALDVVLTYSPGVGSRAVAEHGLYLMLALARSAMETLDNQRVGRWDYQVAQRVRGLAGATLAIVGFGHMGRALATLARAMGMKVIAVNRNGTPETLAEATCALGDVETVLPTADFVVICLPLNPDTRGFFNATRLSRMSKLAALINLSRGAIVDQAALMRALESGHLRAALDVTDPEPLPPDHPLWTVPNLLVTPHIAAAGQSTHDREYLAELVKHNVSRFVRQMPLLNHVSTHRFRGAAQEAS